MSSDFLGLQVRTLQNLVQATLGQFRHTRRFSKRQELRGSIRVFCRIRPPKQPTAQWAQGRLHCHCHAAFAVFHGSEACRGLLDPWLALP